MTLASALKRSGAKVPAPKPQRGPVWTGPSGEGLNGGITQSMLSRFLCCRERFRLTYIEGLKPTDQFNHRLEYGQMWHACEEALASERSQLGEVVGTTLWQDNLKTYAQQLCKRYPLAQEQIDHWYSVCKTQFPIYVDYWAKHPDVITRTPLLQEQVFDVPYELPSGRTVRLRGKWDSVDLIGKGKGAGIYLQENKTKSDIDEVQLKRQLSFDLQTMLYLVALAQCANWRDSVDSLVGVKQAPILGVRYNVVRRPCSGGRGSIVRHKATKNKPEETKESYYDRLRQIIDGSGEDAPGPDYFFMRWKVEISPADVQRFRRECLDPILEQLCDWWEWVTTGDVWKERHLDASPGDPLHVSDGPFNRLHWRHPFGVYNVLDEGGSSDVDEYLRTGSEVGLRRVDSLFEELI